MRRLGLAAILAALLLPALALAWAPMIRSGGGRMMRAGGWSAFVLDRYQFSPSGATVTASVRGTPLAVTGSATTVCDTSKIPICWTSPVNTAAIGPSGALIYGARTNLITKSSRLNDSQWAYDTAYLAVDTDAAIGPRGGQTAERLRVTQAGNFLNLGQGFSPSVAVHTCSFAVRGDTVTSLAAGIYQAGWPGQTIRILWGPGSANQSTVPNVTGLSTTQWTRVAITSNAALSGGANILFYPRSTSSQAVGNAVFLADVQCEAGAEATPWIETEALPVSAAATVFSTPIPNYSKYVAYEVNGSAHTLDISSAVSPLTIGQGQTLDVTGTLLGLRFCRAAGGDCP